MTSIGSRGEHTAEHAREVARRASSFGAAAAAYAEHRPDYPIEGIRWGLDGRRPERVLDLGAGTGKLTAGLVALGMDVVAVEPDGEMLAQLRALLPEVAAHQAGAEAIPLADDSVDAVFVGQALHWFDLTVALPEMARVLRPGGVLVALWNAHDESVPWLAGLLKLIGEFGHRGNPAAAERRYPPFGAPERADFPHRQRRTADSLVATMATHSARLVLPPDERAALLRQMRDYLAEQPETAQGEFDLPLVTMVMRLTVPPA